MIVRRIARPLLASWFLAEGWDAVRAPGVHADRIEAAWHRLGRRVDLPPTPSRRALSTAARAHGAAMVGAAGLLALGQAPRTSALVLAGLTVPLVVSELPLRPDGHRETAVGERAVLRARFWRTASMLGAAMLAAVDTEGRPGMAWRVEHARAERAAAHAE